MNRIDAFLAGLVLTSLTVASVMPLMSHKEPKRPAAPASLEATGSIPCTCADRPEGCETRIFAETGSPAGPVAYCAMWPIEGGTGMACCGAGSEEDR